MADSAIILYNKDKKVLLQHRSDDAPTSPGKWCLFGGGIEKGENPLEAIKREGMEELEYPLKNPKFMVISKEKGGTYIFVEEYDKSKKIVLKEGQGMGWFDLNEIKDLDLVPPLREILTEWRNKQP